MTLKDPMEVKLTIEQSQDPKGFSGDFPLAVKFKGKSGESNYQLVDDFQIDGKQKVVDLEIEDIGKISSVYFKSYFAPTNPKNKKALNIISSKIEVDA